MLSYGELHTSEFSVAAEKNCLFVKGNFLLVSAIVLQPLSQGSTIEVLLCAQAIALNVIYSLVCADRNSWFFFINKFSVPATKNLPCAITLSPTHSRIAFPPMVIVRVRQGCTRG